MDTPQRNRSDLNRAAYVLIPSGAFSYKTSLRHKKKGSNNYESSFSKHTADLGLGALSIRCIPLIVTKRCQNILIDKLKS